MRTTAGLLEQNHLASPVMASRCRPTGGALEIGIQLPSARHLCPGSALKGSFEGTTTASLLLPPDLSFPVHTAFVFLWRDALHREPWRSTRSKGRSTRAMFPDEERFGPSLCVEFNKLCRFDEVFAVNKKKSFCCSSPLTLSTACFQRS